MLKRFTRIRNYRVFTNFAWPAALPLFPRYNLIYGWNGSGKTTISTILRAMQNSTAITNADIEVDIDGHGVACHNFGATPMPAIKVFDRHFVSATVFEAGGQFSPIYVLGEDSVEKQQRVEVLRKELAQALEDIRNRQVEKDGAERYLDDFCISQGKLIRELLNTSGQGTYNSYDKGRFKRRAEAFTAESAKATLLSDDQKNELKSLKDTAPKESLHPLSITVPDPVKLRERAEQELSRSIVAQVIEELASAPDIAAWVQRGLALHQGENASDTCRFCGQELPRDRIAELENHFSDDFRTAQATLKEFIQSLSDTAARLQGQSFHNDAELYGDLVAEYKAAIQQVKAATALFVQFLTQLREALWLKQANPLTRPQLKDYLASVDVAKLSEFPTSIANMNAILARHNKQTENFSEAVEAVRLKLELALVAEAYPEFVSRRQAVLDATARLRDAQLLEPKLRQEIDAIEKDIVEHRRPVAELNAELGDYLGRSELKLEFKDTGYAITRTGQPASDLSEGEKTAIAFLYFLKSLKDKSFKLAESIVVIDDPVSSLDANSLFCAFGFMRDRTQQAGQLFILTHNFSFFRQVRSWFSRLPHQKKKDVAARPAQFYLLNSFFKEGHRDAALQPLDPLLRDYESEYHYLFKRVATEASKDSGDGTLEHYYGMPNVARRLLEGFLAFRLPELCGELSEQMAKVQFNEAKKAKMLRFLHTFSHNDSVGEGDHDISVLSETRSVLGDVIELIKTVDPDHFAAMSKLIAPQTED
jgi:wobble nucleotide-excising tRNase